MGARDRAAHGRKRASHGTAPRPASDGVSAASLAGIAADSAREDAHVFASGAVARTAEGGAGGGEGLRHESGVHRGAVPSGDSRRWIACRLSLGAFAERALTGTGTCGR